MKPEEIHTPKPFLEFKYHKYHKTFKLGGSLGITITEPLKLIGITSGHDRVSVIVEGDHITIRKVNGKRNGG